MSVGFYVELAVRLAAIQDKRPVNMPVMVGSKHEVSADDRRSLMMSISAVLPDHNARLHALQVRPSTHTTIQYNTIIAFVERYLRSVQER